jgi:hypothetical protein
MYCKDSGTKHVKNAVGLKKCLFNCSKSPSYTKARTGTPLHAGSEAASEPSTAADTEISPVEGECNTHTNKPPSAAAAAAMSALKTGKSSPSKCTSFLYFDSKNQTGNSQLDERLGRAIFSTGSPLSLVENKDWITFIEKKLRPGYKLPSRSTLSSRLLENEYQRVEALVKTTKQNSPKRLWICTSD